MAESIFSPSYKSLTGYNPAQSPVQANPAISNIPGYSPQTNYADLSQYSQGNYSPVNAPTLPERVGLGETSQFEPTETGGGFSLGDWTKLGTGAAQAYLGYKGLKLGEKQFDFSKGAFNVNLANQAKLINTEMEARQRARLETSGQYAGREGGQAELQSDLQSYLKPRQVSGAPI